MKNLSITITLWLLLAWTLSAQSFQEYFADSTLRIDYTLVGNHQQQAVYLDKLNRSPRWAGRRTHLNELPLLGNGQLFVRTLTDRQTIYCQSFSSLFQEWIETDEAQHLQKSFEHCMLIPFPKQPVEVEIQLRNNRQEIVCSLTHIVNPADILIHRIGEKQITPHKTMLQPDDTTHCIDIAFLAEGYTRKEMDTFYKDVQAGIESLFAHEPYRSNKGKFRITAVASPSIESGVSIPRLNDWRQTAFSSHFSTFYSDRYLTTLHIKAIHDALAGIPYEHIIILANTAEYGGGGIYNSYNLTAAHHPKYKPVVVHEFGHSFAGLADEYYYDTPDAGDEMYTLDIEPWEPNITTKKDKEKAATVGNIEGGGYRSKGIWRYQNDCRMRTNEYPEFCPICQQAIEHIIRFYTE